jgi:hypothetical protein
VAVPSSYRRSTLKARMTPIATVLTLFVVFAAMVWVLATR